MVTPLRSFRGSRTVLTVVMEKTYFMKDHTNFSSHVPSVEDPAEKIVEHLLRAPSDLIDTRHLMRRFRASVDDVLRALRRLEDAEPEVNSYAVS